MSFGGALAIALVSFCLYDIVAGGLFPEDRFRRCRQPIVRGTCHNNMRRWGYNSLRGECVPFEYTGCGGDENNFEDREECMKCCRNTPACPRYRLEPPREGCRYNWFTGRDGCNHNRLECGGCERQYCRPDSCRFGYRCMPRERNCGRECPCKAFECIRDPCEPWFRRPHSRCQTCVAIREPGCLPTGICPLVPRYRNTCGLERLGEEIEDIEIREPFGIREDIRIREPFGFGLREPFGLGLREPFGLGLREPFGLREEFGLREPFGLGLREPFGLGFGGLREDIRIREPFGFREDIRIREPFGLGLREPFGLGLREPFGLGGLGEIERIEEIENLEGRRGCGYEYHRCRPNWNPCKFRRCHRHPNAVCHVDRCDCRKCSWNELGREYRDIDCY